VKAWIGLGAGYGLPDFAKAIGDDVNGLFNTESPGAINVDGLAPEAAALYKEFRARFVKRKDREPTTNSNVGFIGAWTLMKHVIRGRQPRARQAARGRPQAGPADNSLVNGWGMKFNAEGTNVRARTTMMQWQGGKLVTVFPENLSTGKPTMIPLPRR
jgi:branched-chain amino acid transport system substrate-binding protein